MYKRCLVVLGLALATGGCEEFSGLVSSPQPEPHYYVPPPPQIEESPLPAEGEIRVLVLGAVAKTKSTVGPYTGFLVRRVEPSDDSNVKHRNFYVYVRSDDNVGALERGSIIGMLMGAAETNAWNDERISIEVMYTTTPVGIEVYAAAIGDARLSAPAKPPS